MAKLMLDICSGSKSASAAMRERGWDVLSLDIDKGTKPDVVADIREYKYIGKKPELIWCSPPCDEFARELLPWIPKTGRPPDMSIFLSCFELVKQIRPRYWIIENVRGAVKYFYPHIGEHRARYGPFFLWGYFPPLGKVSQAGWRHKSSRSSEASKERAAIPYSLSAAVAEAIEKQLVLPGIMEE